MIGGALHLWMLGQQQGSACRRCRAWLQVSWRSPAAIPWPGTPQ